MALKQANTLAPSNVSATGFALADARHIGGHRVVATLAGLYALQDWQLLNPDETDTELAVGQQWYVKGTGFYRLTNWGNRKSAAGWTRVVDPNNIDTTLFEIVSALPTTGINKNRIYLVQTASSTKQNTYAEFMYTGDTTAAYDESKWEKLGEYKPEVDLTPYAKTTYVDTKVGEVKTDLTDLDKRLSTAEETATRADTLAKGNQSSITTINSKLVAATTSQDGFMSAADKSTLDSLSVELTSGERNNVVVFDDIIDVSITVQTASTTTPESILYSTANGTFVAKNGNNYFANWSNAYKYGTPSDLGYKPSKEKLYNLLGQKSLAKGDKGALYRYGNRGLVKVVNIDIDTSLSDTSSNPVANSVVKVALDTKVDASTYNTKMSTLEAKNTTQDAAIAAKVETSAYNTKMTAIDTALGTKVDKADIEVMTTDEVDALFA